jgi:hypothetical protein
MCGRQNGFVIQKEGFQSFQFLPGDTATIFQFSRVLGVPGCSGIHRWAAVGQTVYYHSSSGFYAFGPGGSRPIGKDKVDRTFRDDTASTNPLQMIVVADPFMPHIRFAAKQENSAAHFNFGYIYDWQLDRWSQDGLAAQWWMGSQATAPLARLFAIGAIGAAGQIRYQGATSGGGGVVTTSYFEVFQSGPNAGQRALVSAIRPITDSAPAAVTVQSLETLDGLPSTTVSGAAETNGRFSLMASGAYHKFIVGGGSSEGHYLNAVQVWAQPDGEA